MTGATLLANHSGNIYGSFSFIFAGPALQTAKTSHEQTTIRRQIETTDRRIDRLVYELYGMTEEEIRIVEEATA